MAAIRTWSRSPSASSRALLLAAALASAAAPAIAADLQVYPVRLTLDAATPAGSLTVVNRGTAGAVMQAGVYVWSQPDGEDRLEPTRDVLVNPGIFSMKPGDQQIVRFGLRVAAADPERSYRIILQEIPQQRTQGGLATLLRMSIPLFVPTVKPAPAIAWTVRPAAGGLEVVARNTGNVHVQIRNLRLAGPDGRVIGERALNAYILPGVARTLPIAAKGAAPSLQLRADTDQGTMEATVAVTGAVGAAADVQPRP